MSNLSKQNLLALAILLVLLLVVISSEVLAEQSKQQINRDPDIDMPLEISANSFETNTNSDFSTYQGSVKISQGSLQITADNVTIEHPNNKVTKIIATGQIASLKKIIFSSNKLLQANAKTISYKQKNLILETNASFTFDGNTISGEYINFNLEDETLQAKSHTESNESNGRVRIVIQPTAD